MQCMSEIMSNFRITLKNNYPSDMSERIDQIPKIFLVSMVEFHPNSWNFMKAWNSCNLHIYFIFLSYPWVLLTLPKQYYNITNLWYSLILILFSLLYIFLRMNWTMYVDVGVCNDELPVVDIVTVENYSDTGHRVALDCSFLSIFFIYLENNIYKVQNASFLVINLNKFQ